MLKYLIIQLDDSATSFCHYGNKSVAVKLMPLDILKKAVVWSMQENLMVQFVLPDYTLPEEYCEVIDSVDHVSISDGNANGSVDVNVFNGVSDLDELKENPYRHIVLRLTKEDLFRHIEDLKEILKIQPSVNIVLTDIESVTEKDYLLYKDVLDRLSSTIESQILSKEMANVSILTDRLSLNSMNNCGAGDETITLAPNGSFYVCPAFYFNDECPIGNINEGISIPNEQLYKLEYAPICRTCDAYQCKRCIWLNKKLTLEVNIPSHQQCVLSHLERNASRKLLNSLVSSGKVLTDMSIPEIDYLDPFENLIKK